MKSIVEFIYESVDFINEGTSEEKEMKKWLKQNGAKKMKVVNGEVVLVGKTGTSINELKLQPDVEELPDFVKFQKKPYDCTLELEGKSLKTLKGFPAPGPAAYLELYNCTSLKDFDLDLSNTTGGAIIELHDCTNLESLSGFKTAKKSSHGNGLFIYNSPKLKSLKELKDFSGDMSIILENVGISDLEGYPTQEKNYEQKISIIGAPNLVSLDGYHSKGSPRVIEFRDCPKLSKLGDISFTKKKEVDFIYFINCPKVDDAFLEGLLELCKIEDGYGKLQLINTGVKADSDVIKRFKKKYPSKTVEIE